MASARYWRVVGIETYGGGDLELGGFHWYAGGTRIDASATLTCNSVPVSGTLANLQDTDTATTTRFSGSQVRSGGFRLVWDFGTPVVDPYPRIAAAAVDKFIGWGTLQYSSDNTTWTTDTLFGRVIYPGFGQQTPADPKFRIAAPSDWDVASKGSSATITGRIAEVRSNFTGIARTNSARTSGRRVFGLRLTKVTPSQMFFGGLAALASWGSYNVGKHWAVYGYDGSFTYYPTGVEITVSPAPGAPTAVGDVMYFDVNLDTGFCSLKKNAGSWTTPVALPNFVIGDSYVIDLMAPSTSGDILGAELLTSALELGANIPSGAQAWDSASGTDDFSADFVVTKPLDTSEPFWREAIAGSVGAATTNAAAPVRDIYLAGRGSITATVKEDGTPTDTPVRRKVRLFRDRDGLLVRETWSDATTGAYSFAEINENETYSVVSYDHNDNYRAVIADRITPTVA